MFSPSLLRKPNWIAGTIELTSKVRYGLSTRGVPQFRFVPYDKTISPMAVGCSVRNLFYNVHAIIEPVSIENTNKPPGDSNPTLASARVGLEPSQESPKGNELPKGTLVQTLGTPSESSEETVLLTTYAFDSQKDLRKEFAVTYIQPAENPSRIHVTEGVTFHIDPRGCKDVDDSFTFTKLSDTQWRVWIHIADVDAWIKPGTGLDENACRRATSFYTSTGYAIAPMLPKQLSEDLASLKGGKKPSLSLCFLWEEGQKPTDFEWKLTYSKVDHSFTYEDAHTGAIEEFGALQRLAYKLGGDPGDSHSWVEQLMILYNTKAGELLKENSVGILRRHSGKSAEKAEALGKILETFPDLRFLAYEAAEFCLPTAEQTTHVGLEKAAYAYASSPLRRYADLLNQRVIKQILFGTQPTPFTQDLVNHLNRRQKQAKAFSRELFFSQVLSNAEPGSYEEGIVICHCKKGYKVYLDAWKTVITVRVLGLDPLVKSLSTPPEPGSRVRVEWYDDRGKPHWKDRIVFHRIELKDD
jgi:exoribonuclease R